MSIGRHLRSDDELAAELFDDRRRVEDYALIADEEGSVDVFIAPVGRGLALVHIEREEDRVASVEFLRRRGVREYSSLDEFISIHGEPGPVIVRPIDE